MICYLPTLAATRAEAQKATYLPRKGGLTRGLGLDGATMARRGQSSLRHDHAHSQVSAPVLPAPQFTQFLLERVGIEGTSAHCVVRCLTPVTLAAAADF